MAKLRSMRFLCWISSEYLPFSISGDPITNSIGPAIPTMVWPIELTNHWGEDGFGLLTMLKIVFALSSWFFARLLWFVFTQESSPCFFSNNSTAAWKPLSGSFKNSSWSQNIILSIDSGENSISEKANARLMEMSCSSFNLFRITCGSVPKVLRRSKIKLRVLGSGASLSRGQKFSMSPIFNKVTAAFAFRLDAFSLYSSVVFDSGLFSISATNMDATFAKSGLIFKNMTSCCLESEFINKSASTIGLSSVYSARMSAEI